MVKHLGIYERRLDYEFGGRRKRSRADGGLFDGDLALRAGRAALDDAGIDAAEVDVVVHVTTTPDLIACQDQFRYLMTELGLRRDADLVHHNLGCAGLSAGFRTAACYLVSMAPATAMVVASNCPSGYFGPEVHDFYYKHRSGLGWLAPLMFADGGGAAIWRSSSGTSAHVPPVCYRCAPRPAPTSSSSPIRGADACTTRQRPTWPTMCSSWTA